MRQSTAGGTRTLWSLSLLLIDPHSSPGGGSTSYAAQNGGRYEFIVERGRYSANPTEGGIALPIDARFWHELLRNKTKAIGPLLTGVEIDWM